MYLEFEQSADSKNTIISNKQIIPSPCDCPKLKVQNPDVALILEYQ